jgi:hypothetical protein
MHDSQDVVAGAVEDAGDAGDAIAGQALAQRLDDGDAAGDGRLEGERRAGCLCESSKLGTMHGEQGLVGCDHRLPGCQRGLHQRSSGPFGAADHFHHDIDSGIGRQGHGIIEPAQAGERHAAIARAVARGDRSDSDRAAGAGRDEVRILAQQRQNTGAYRAEAGEADGKRTGHNADPSWCGMAWRGQNSSVIDRAPCEGLAES